MVVGLMAVFVGASALTIIGNANITNNKNSVMTVSYDKNINQNILNLSGSAKVKRDQIKGELLSITTVDSTQSINKNNKGAKTISVVLVIGIGLAILIVSLITAIRATWRRHKRRQLNEQNE